LEYFLTGCRQNQKEIKDFVNRCKENENSEGFLTQDFFQILKSKEAKFFTGPFTNMIFKIIENQKNRLKILLGNVETTINKNSGYLFRSV